MKNAVQTIADGAVPGTVAETKKDVAAGEGKRRAAP
jgi:hypothetical protein